MKSLGLKILIVGLPKTGTTALYCKILHSLPKKTIGLFEPKKYVSRITFEKKDIVAKVLCPPEFNVGSRTIRASELNSFDSFNKKILLLRDPRDTLISSLIWTVYELGKQEGYEFIDKLMKNLRNKEKNPKSFSVVDFSSMLRSHFSVPESYIFIKAVMEAGLESLPLPFLIGALLSSVLGTG